MRYYIIFGTSINGNTTGIVTAKNKYSAIEEFKKRTKEKRKFIPIIVKRISKRYHGFLLTIFNYGAETGDVQLGNTDDQDKAFIAGYNKAITDIIDRLGKGSNDGRV